MNIWQLRKATHCFAQGGIVAYPTEAIYGFGCDPFNEEAVKKLLAIKQRPWQKGLILIACDYQQLENYLEPLSPLVQQRVLATWPGPVTWLLPARPQVPYWLTGQSKQLAVRVTAHPEASELCRYWKGALVSTSANVSNHLPARTALEVRLRFHRLIDKVVPGKVGGRSQPTEIRDALTNTLLRA